MVTQPMPGAGAAPVLPPGPNIPAQPGAAPAAAPAGPGAAAPQAGAVVFLAAVAQPPNTSVPSPQPAAPAGGPAAAPAPGAAPAAPAPPPPQPFPVALLNALLNARSTLDEIWEAFEAKALIDELKTLVALKDAADLPTFGTQITALKQADSAYRAERSQKSQYAEFLDEQGVYLITHHQKAAETLERSIREAVKPKDEVNRELLGILDRWENKAQSGRGAARGKRIKPAAKPVARRKRRKGTP